MNPEEYQAYTIALQSNLEQNPDVIGLVALGSMAKQDYQPDRWSDHDFFVMTKSGKQEELRQNLSWLPDHENIVLALRETAHGLKVLYRDGHLVEFAVFDTQELYLSKVNRYRLLFEREEDIAQHLTRIKSSVIPPQHSPQEDFKEISMFLCNLLIGVGRHKRGEQLSGHEFVKTFALSSLVFLLEKHLPSSRKEVLDNLNNLRRFELVYPELGLELNQLLLNETPQAALKLMALAERELSGKMADFPAEAFAVVRHQAEEN